MGGRIDPGAAGKLASMQQESLWEACFPPRAHFVSSRSLPSLPPHTTMLPPPRPPYAHTAHVSATLVSFTTTRHPHPPPQSATRQPRAPISTPAPGPNLTPLQLSVLEQATHFSTAGTRLHQRLIATFRPVRYRRVAHTVQTGGKRGAYKIPLGCMWVACEMRIM